MHPLELNEDTEKRQGGTAIHLSYVERASAGGWLVLRHIRQHEVEYTQQQTLFVTLLHRKHIHDIRGRTQIHEGKQIH